MKHTKTVLFIIAVFFFTLALIGVVFNLITEGDQPWLRLLSSVMLVPAWIATIYCIKSKE